MFSVLAASLFVPAMAAAYTVYITNEKDNTVSIIDSTKLEVTQVPSRSASAREASSCRRTRNGC